jgi:ribose 5-phosphate isomerase B
MKIAVGADHAGFGLKQEIVDFLKEKDYDYHDFGTMNAQRVDYPDLAEVVSEAVACGEYDIGILVCGSGIGMSIAANKVPGIRAALCFNSFMARMTRDHNNANVLVLGDWIVGSKLAFDIVETFLSTPFCNKERHAKRVRLIAALERKHRKGP